MHGCLSSSFMEMREYLGLFILLICYFSRVEGGVVANFTINFEYVSTDEIILLQNAIEDTGFIDTMPVQPLDFATNDVPPPPVNVTTRVISSTEIEVSWDGVDFSQGSTMITGYAVFYKRYQPTIQTYWNRVTVTDPSVLSLNVTYLEQFTLYTFRVLAFTSAGNGISSNFVDEKTAEGVPAAAPSNFFCIAKSPTQIMLTWDFLEGNLWNGYEYRYVIQYRIYRSNGNTTDVFVDSSTKSYVLEGLEQFTHYEIFLRASTKIGVGDRNWCTEATEEGVPSVGPVITSSDLDPLRPLEALITWDPLPDSAVNGYLKGYVLYYGTTRVGKNAIEYPEMTRIEFDKFTLRYLLKGLQIYSQTRVIVKGNSRVGEGVASVPAYIETCTCPQSIYTAWFANKPYISEGADGKVSGIFPNILQDMVDFLCGKCTGSLKPTLYWDRTKTGHSPVRENEKELKKMVSNNVHIHVAMFGRSEIERFQSDYRYVSIITSPGIAFIVRDPLAELDRTATIMTSLLGCWPSIIIIFLFSMVAGIFVWIADCQVNEEEFPGESFIRGIYHGAYWAFVSMTTVGYGDKTPRSFFAQVIAIAWMLMGPIINGIVVGAITTSLTTINLEEDPKIYGTKVAALHETFEYNLGVRRNAKMDNGVNYTKKEQMVDDLANRVVDGVLVDSLVAADMYETLAEKKLKIIKLIPERSGWGIILSGELLRLEEEIRSFVKSKEEDIKKIVANQTDGKLTIGVQPPSDLDTGIVDPESQMFKDFVLYGLICYVILVILGLTFEHGYLRMRKKRVVPYSQEHRSLLENNLANIVTDFCKDMTNMIEEKSSRHESEVKRLFWKKGYSFGVDGWFREKTNNEEMLKNKIRYHEIMFKDLGFYEKRNSSPFFQKGKNIVRVAPVPTKSPNYYNESNT